MLIEQAEWVPDQHKKQVRRKLVRKEANYLPLATSNEIPPQMQSPAPDGVGGSLPLTRELELCPCPGCGTWLLFDGRTKEEPCVPVSTWHLRCLCDLGCVALLFSLDF